MLRQVRIGFALRNNSFKIVLTGEPEKPLPIFVDVVAVKETFASFRNDCMKPELAVDQRQIAKVFATAESLALLLIVRFGVFIPENVECDEARLGTPEQKITELRLAISIDANDLAIEDAAATLKVASESVAKTRETFERVSIARDQPDTTSIGVQQRPEPVPFDFEKPIRMREWRRGAAKRQWLESWKKPRNQYSQGESIVLKARTKNISPAL